VGRTSWKSLKDLGLAQGLVGEWVAYVEILKSKFIFLKGEDRDSLCWAKNHVNCMNTIKLFYLALAKEDLQEFVQWWWVYIYILNSPLKVSLVYWLALRNKILTWEVELKRGWIGPRKCTLCVVEEETAPHLFVYYPFARNVWNGVFNILKIYFHVSGNSLEEWLFVWKKS
jgi:hypothetical protein